MELVRIDCLRAVNGLAFGCSEHTLVAALGVPDAHRLNYDGELEMCFGDAIYRCRDGLFVECTYPDTQRSVARTLVIDGVPVVALYEWLAEQPDSVDLARFRISLARGIAYDRRDPEAPSYTLFARGHWDGLF